MARRQQSTSPTLGDVLNSVVRVGAKIHILAQTVPFPPNATRPPLIAPAQHNYFEVAICFEGEMSFVGYSSTLSLKPGDAVVVRPGAWHYESCRRASQPYRVCWIIVTSHSTACLFTHYRRGQFTVSTMESRPPQEETALLDELSREIIVQPLHWRAKSRALLVQLLADFDRHLHLPQTTVQRQQPDPIRTLLRIVQASFREPLQVKSLAKEIGLSPDHLTRRFYKACGTTFKDYLNTIRIHHAQQLLRSGCAIKHAAADSGFRDVCYFNRVFKHHCQTTPGKFVNRQPAGTTPPAPD